MNQNPLMQMTGLPDFPNIHADHVVEAMRKVLASAREELKRLEDASQPESPEQAWDVVIGELEALMDRIHQPWGVVTHLLGVRNTEALRAAHAEIQTEIVALSVEMSQSQAMYQHFCRLRAAGSDSSEVKRRILDSQLKDAQLSGVALDGPDRQRFRVISERLAKLSTQFSNNVLDATKAWSLLLSTPQDVQGLPESYLAMAAQSARSQGHPEASAQNGPWLLTLDFPSFGPFLRHSRRRDLRKRAYMAYITRASSGERDNGPLIDEILALRRDKADLLGFESYAALSLETKMAEDVDAVRAQLYALLTASRTQAERELQEIEALARDDGHDIPLRQWDIAFWAERLREKRYALDEESLRPWFPFPKVLDGMLNLSSRIFDLRFEDRSTEVARWHEDVRYYIVTNLAGEPRAAFFLDPYARPAEKRGGAWMDECLGRSARMGSKEAPRLPVAYLVCNGTPPVDDKPSLMTFREVETLFHEFGHGLQHMLTTVDEGLASGIRNVEWDAVELPSQFMENWCYDKATMAQISGHVDTGHPLPDDIFERLRAARTFRAASAMLRQLDLALVDLALHHEHRGELSVQQVRANVGEQTSLLTPLAEDRFLCGFSHIFAGGYAAGYYSYKWAEILSADAFAAFEEAGLSKDAEIRAVGLRFRDTVLASGGARAPMQVYEDFRGRQPSTEALLRHSGLT
ncbi:MAG: peptidase M3 [Myxococcales bacterium]|nr:peptidase M3 [Myxococcales bacterium]